MYRSNAAGISEIRGGYYGDIRRWPRLFDWTLQSRRTIVVDRSHYLSRMSSWLRDTASAPSDTGERRAGLRRGSADGSGDDRSTGRPRTTSRRPRTPRYHGPRAYTDRTSSDRSEQKSPRSLGYWSDSSPRTSPTDSSPPFLCQVYTIVY